MAKLCLVGYTFRGYAMAKAIERAKALGYDGMELRDFADMDLSSPEAIEGALPPAVHLLGDAGLSLDAIWYASLPVSRDGERQVELRAFKQVLAVLAEAGRPILHTRLSLRRRDGRGQVVSAGAYEDDYEAVQTTLRDIAPLAERHGVRIALEAHMGYIHDTAASLLRIVSECDSPCVTGTLDFANILITNPGECLSDVPRRFGRHAGYTHLKNVKLLPHGYDWNLPLRYGDVNYRALLHALQACGYDGPLAVEYVGTGDAEDIAADDVRYLRALCEEMGM